MDLAGYHPVIRHIQVEARVDANDSPGSLLSQKTGGADAKAAPLFFFLRRPLSVARDHVRVPDSHLPRDQSARPRPGLTSGLRNGPISDFDSFGLGVTQ
jgi:hypothetical protein